MAVVRSARRDSVDVERSGARMTGAEENREAAALASDNFRAEPGSLYVVATPIGNLRDLTLRALDVLRTVDVIRAEDTRVTSVLLARYGITTRPHSLHQHNEARQIASVLDDLAAGRSVALVSDAGTPGISDPGARLVRAATDARHRVIPIPGANAAATAISAAGLHAERFLFVGFLPAQAKARRELLETVAALPVALVIYEAPHRVAATLRQLIALLDPARTLTIARELTKTFETIAMMPLADASAWVAADANRERGEFVLIVDAAPAAPPDREISGEARRLLAALLEELPPARAARVAAKVTGMPRDLLYEHASRASSTRRDDG
jgi:16S rRNA (cytidine1402-2'-O)-methyltransferase